MVDIQLVIFDCDGVLVDSEAITHRVSCAMLNDIGVTLSLEDMFERFVGRSMAQCLETITELRGGPPPESFVPELRRRVIAALEAEVQPIPGIHEALAAMELPCCVATSGDPEKIRIVLQRTNLWERFAGRIFNVAEVPRPKPAPDVYLLAAKTHGVAPENCAVIEDSPTGVRAGVAAGMRVFGFAAHTPAEHLREAGAGVIFDDMQLLPRLLMGGGEEHD